MTITEKNSEFFGIDSMFFKSYQSLVKNNNGYYKSEKQVDYLEHLLETYSEDLDVYNIADNPLFEDIKDQYTKYHTYVILSGRHIPCSFVRIPFIIIFVLDHSGIVAKYKVKHELKSVSKGHYEPYDIELVWERSTENVSMGRNNES